MKKNSVAIYIIAAIIVIAFTIGAILAMSSQLLKTNSTAPAQTDNAGQAKTDAPEVTDSPVAHTPGMYMDFDKESFDAHAEQRRVLFFHAPWCPQCVALDKDIMANDLPDDIAIFKVDYDSNQDLRKKHGVTLQTTFVLVDKNGEQINKYTAYATPNFAAVKSNLLD